MNYIIVTGNTLTFNGKIYACAIGKAGFSADKKEGDNCTPTGTFPLREVWYRADKMDAPKTALPLRIITQNDGWCDDVSSEEYNRHMLRHPFERRNPENKALDSSFRWNDAEMLWREDDLYDVVVVIGYNDAPVVADKGSAIFMHIAKPAYAGTEGCVALEKRDLLDVLRHCDAQTMIVIEKA